MSITVYGKRVTAVLFALITALALAGAGEAQEAGSAGERAENVVVFV